MNELEILTKFIDKVKSNGISFNSGLNSEDEAKIILKMLEFSQRTNR